MSEFLAHWFLPRKSNNHKANALRVPALVAYGVFLVLLLLSRHAFNKISTGEVLSYATNINNGDLLHLTNQKRLQNGLGVLTVNEKLNQAALAKANDMFANQYWAHTSPSGVDPWHFFNKSGYGFLYAGENLARDFAQSSGVLEAWMNSKSHRENILNSRYKEVGFAVVNGKYGNYETTLVVQLFGTPALLNPSVSSTKKLEANKPEVLSREEVLPSSLVLNSPTNTEEIVVTVPTRHVSYVSIIRLVSFSIAIFLVGVLFVDSIIVFHRKTIRLSGHTTAHFLFFLGLSVLIILVKQGAIL